MGEFVVVTFDDSAMLHQATEALKKLHSEGSNKGYASAVVAKDPSGELSVGHVTKEGYGGTAAGALICGLAGLPLGPLAVTIGAASGAILGASADLLHHRDEAAFAEKILQELAPGKAAVVAEIAEEELTAFEAQMARIGGTVARFNRPPSHP